MWIARTLALALVGAALTTGPVSAAGETCRGQAATIVGGGAGTPISGTDGDDVIVTNGEADVDSGAGDDLICVTGAPDNAVVHVEAGEGADVVDTTQVRGADAAVVATLGPGADRFVGGPRADFVRAGTEDAQDRDVDRIRTGAGDDDVTTGEVGAVDADRVDLGAGRGLLRLESERSTGTLRAAQGADARVLLLSLRTAGRWVVDDRHDRATHDGRTMSTWTNFAVAEVHGLRRAAIHYVGTDGPDVPNIFGHAAGARLGSGDDDLILYDVTGLTGAFAGGPGSDRVRFWGEDELLADLDRGRLGTSLTAPGGTIHGVEDVVALWIGTARLVGNAAPNVFEIRVCQASVRTEAGNDRLKMRGDGPACPSIPVEERGVRAFGGTGNDILHGSDYDDDLVGGPGRDQALGRDGVDYCRAEERIDCEA